MRTLMFLMVCSLLCCSSFAQPVTWYVSGETGSDTGHTGIGDWNQAFATIQKAVASSADGAVILVSNGTYVLNSTITVGKRNIIGFSGTPSDTVVDGNYNLRCFVLDQPESFLSGLTITKGKAVQANMGGGGVTINNGGTVSNCWILNNRGDSTDAPYVHGGGGILLRDAGGSVLNCLIADNVSSNDGGGIMLRQVSGAAVVRDCIISNNQATRHGGGLYVYASPEAEISNCVVVDNFAQNSGGGVGIGSVSGVFKHSILKNNHALIGGGGVYKISVGFLVSDCLITENRVTEGVSPAQGGGGVLIVNNGHLANCTIVNNSANVNAGGIVFYTQLSGNSASILNTIVYSNTKDAQISNWAAGNATHKNSIDYYNCCLTPLAGLSPSSSDNLEVDPLFVQPANGDYRLQATSLCINAGINQDWMTDAFDLDGRPRLDRFRRLVDMGCYETVLQGSMFTIK